MNLRSDLASMTCTSLNCYQHNNFIDTSGKDGHNIIQAILCLGKSWSGTHDIIPRMWSTCTWNFTLWHDKTLLNANELKLLCRHTAQYILTLQGLFMPMILSQVPNENLPSGSSWHDCHIMKNLGWACGDRNMLSWKI